MGEILVYRVNSMIQVFVLCNSRDRFAKKKMSSTSPDKAGDYSGEENLEPFKELQKPWYAKFQTVWQDTSIFGIATGYCSFCFFVINYQQVGNHEVSIPRCFDKFTVFDKV